MSELYEGAELKGESGKTYLAVSPLGQANVWTAVDKDDYGTIVVLKAPAASEDTGTSWPRFQHEMVMHELFKDAESVRRQVDRIPPVDDMPPILVLEIFDGTLWDARAKRPFSKAEIKTIARSILQGLQEVHDQGLVFADLKMQNVMLSGFKGGEEGGDGSKLDAKLGDLGIVMEPANGKVQPVAYRAPEVFFKADITQAADVWAFGLLYCHLLEAQHRFSKTGLYDDLYIGGGSMPEREQAMRHAMANDYDIAELDYYKGVATPYRDHDHATGEQWDELRRRGLSNDDVEFLQWILNPDPTERPTAQAILDSRWLSESGEETRASEADISNQASQQNDPKPYNAPLQVVSGLGSTLTRGDSRGSMANHRRDANSSRPAGPTSINLPASRPEALLRGVSQATFTPSGETPAASGGPLGQFTPSSGGVFDYLHRQRGQTSPIKEHPLVQSALADQPEPEPSNLQVVEAAEGGAEADTMGVDQVPDPSKVADVEMGDTAGPKRPKNVQHLGRNSQSGGTYLSYR